MSAEHVDVLIVGAGISGVGAACRLQRECPGKSFAVLEARGVVGGTWDLFRFPGIRSDSDMWTLSYPFRPWSGAQAIADGAAILEYIQGTARENALDDKIRFHHRVVGAEWSSSDAQWTVAVERGDTGETLQMTCNFLYSCTGYYRYEQAYTPEFQGIERFGGEIVHPQFWTEDIDYAGKRVVVIGSGATAVTVVPAMAEKAAHVTMLQRSPSYYAALPSTDPIADWLRAKLGKRAAHRVNRAKNFTVITLLLMAGRRWPDRMSKLLQGLVERELSTVLPMNPHFTPSYQPLEERIGIVPDGDLFTAFRQGRASMVTDHIERFTGTGLRLRSGAEIEADIVVTATGLKAVSFGEISVTVDGR